MLDPNLQAGKCTPAVSLLTSVILLQETAGVKTREFSHSEHDVLGRIFVLPFYQTHAVATRNSGLPSRCKLLTPTQVMWVGKQSLSLRRQAWC